MVQFDGLRPARLKVGIISAGRVGTALGVALERVDHVVVACSAVSRASRQRAERWLPDTPVAPVPDVAEMRFIELIGTIVEPVRMRHNVVDASISIYFVELGIQPSHIR